MHGGNLPDTVFWVEWLIHQVLLLKDPTESLLNEVEVVIEGSKEAFSD